MSAGREAGGDAPGTRRRTARTERNQSNVLKKVNHQCKETPEN